MAKKMNINPKYLKGSKNASRRAQLIRQIADIYKKGKPYPKNLNSLMAERDKLTNGGPRKFNPGGVANPYAMPTSASTSGYTSNMSGMRGAQNAALQLQQLQQQQVDAQRRYAEEDRARSEQEDAAQIQGMQQDLGELASDEVAGQVKEQLAKRAARRTATKLAKTAGAKGANAVQIAAGTANAAQVAESSKNVGQLLGNLGAYGTQAQALGEAAQTAEAAKAAGQAGSAASGIGPGGIGTIASLVGKGVEHVSDDDDATKTNVGEGFGRGLSGVGSGVATAAMLGLGPIGLVGAGLVGGYMALRNQRKKKLEARKEEARRESESARMGAAEQRAFLQSQLETGRDMGYNIGSSMSNSYLPGYQMAEAGGSYMKPLPGGAVEFVGPKHSKGGIMLDPQTEVEGGETMDKVKMRENGGKAGDYIFSDFLKLGKKTFAQRHKEMLSRGATQGDIQKLAKMQEEVAKREGRDENGPRGPERIMEEGGEVNYGGGEGGIPNPDNIDDYELDASGAYAIEFPEGQHETDTGLFGREGKEVTMEDVENLKLQNPWYEWKDFDPADEDDVLAFQKAFNERAGRTIVKEDGNLGEQTASAYIPYKPKAAEVQEETPEETPAETPEETPVGPGMNLRKDILLPYQLIGPMAELTTKYPQPNKVGAPVTGRIKLPRMNMNAERASLAASTNAANKFIQNQSAGPAAIAAQMAMGEKQRQGNIDIATQEARQNKELAATEELGNLRASQFDATNVARARQFNALAQNQRDQNEYEKRMLAFNQLGTNLAQYANDIRSYRTEDRIAEASQIAGEYTRQKYLEELRRQSKRKKSPYHGMNDTQLREVAAQMVQGAPTYNQQDQQRVQAVIGAANALQENTEEAAQQKRGGYVRKMGKIKRRRK